MEDSGFNKIITNIKEKKEQKNSYVSFERSLELARNLLEKYKNEIKGNLYKDVDGYDNGEVYSDYQKSIRHFLSEIPEDIQAQYEGHGITKGTEVDQVAAAISVLANKSIKGDLGKLKKSGYIDAYARGDFIVISSKNQKLIYLGKDESGRNKPTFDKFGAWKANVGAFVVDVKYYPLVEELKEMFPDVNIIKANELPNYLK